MAGIFLKGRTVDISCKLGSQLAIARNQFLYQSTDF